MIAFTRGVKDTSRAGAYHNVHVRDSEHRGRRAVPGGTGQSGGGGRGDDAPSEGGSRLAPTYVCAGPTPRRMRMAPTVYELADVLCSGCGQSFTAGT